VVGAVVISRVQSQLQNSSDNWEVGQFSTSQYEAKENWMQWISDAARSTKVTQRIGRRSTKEYKESACEELTQCVYSKIETVISNCKFRLVYIQ
jgi:hypothetical protein